MFFFFFLQLPSLVSLVDYCFQVSFIISRHFNSRKQQDYLCVFPAQSQARFKIIASPGPESIVLSPYSVVLSL